MCVYASERISVLSPLLRFREHFSIIFIGASTQDDIIEMKFLTTSRSTSVYSHFLFLLLFSLHFCRNSQRELSSTVEFLFRILLRRLLLELESIVVVDTKCY